jgi:hypothetical protein
MDLRKNSFMMFGAGDEYPSLFLCKVRKLLKNVDLDGKFVV